MILVSNTYFFFTYFISFLGLIIFIEIFCCVIFVCTKSFSSVSLTKCKWLELEKRKDGRIHECDKVIYTMCEIIKKKEKLFARKNKSSDDGGYGYCNKFTISLQRMSLTCWYEYFFCRLFYCTPFWNNDKISNWHCQFIDTFSSLSLGLFYVFGDEFGVMC